MNLQEFLQTVVTVPQGYFCLARRATTNGHTWYEEFYEWPSQLDAIVEQSELYKADNDVYFTCYLFDKPTSKKQHVILEGHRTIQADLDYADPKMMQFDPSVLVQTSKGRYQAYWKLSEDHYDHEGLSRKLTYSIHNADKSGWSLGHKVRLPGTFNYKYLSDSGALQAQPVFIIPTPHKLYEPSELDILSDISKESAKADTQFINGVIPQLTIGPNELLETVKTMLPLKVYGGYNTVATDRSAALWALMCSLFRAGLSRDEVLYLAYHSANNKWLNTPRELQKDVLRAEVVSGDMSHDAKEIIVAARKTPGTIAEKHRYVLGAAHALMNELGGFVRTHKGGLYVQKSTGRPIYLNRMDEALQTYLGHTFGLNPTEREEQFVAAGLQVYGNSIVQATECASLSFYDQKANTMLLHTGRKDVIRITPDLTETITNGNGIVFDWVTDSDPFAPVLSQPNTQPNGGLYNWGITMFELHNTTDLTVDEYIAVMRSWFMFLIFRNVSSARPVLCLLGQPGSGKTTTAKRIYTLIYGAQRKISALSTFEDFDNSVSNLPFVFYDNADSFLPWLPDRIAQSAGAIDVGKRALYTNNDSFTIKRNAMIALTAHNPRFMRPDVVDRLILINLSRYGETDFVSEQGLIQQIAKGRNQLWGAIVRDIQQILRTPPITEATVPMRISDFTTMGEWFAIALGYRETFISAMYKLRRAQKFADMEEDQILVGALTNYATHSNHADEYRMPGALWIELLSKYTNDANGFQRQYKSAGNLSKKLSILQAPLSDILSIQSKAGPIRTWRITLPNE